jgi:7-cyano-7-deazaguanine synthase in queuosine biosynthesis
MPPKIESLRVIDRLSVGPVRVERRRLVAPYRVTGSGRQESVDLIYRWEEEVFDPKSAACHNLASMIAAQVALNYGLFCREIEFLGPFDSRDRRFLLSMAENSAREIFVKKFLEPNPFLIGEAAALEPEKRDAYLLAELVFPDPEPRGHDSWATSPSRVGILSSGGKESLLCYGLLTELGQDVHPIFVNESGRHWMTALNAYREFRSSVPNTARVWTNSDRVFSWMLRRMPFVRPDFQTVRADEYPVRLWTVAVFLFGALPLARKRGIGRILVGDEHDTSVRARHQGIPHYDGLYDQSRYFDRALSRYYMAKGWGMVQFSPLRQLSELLVEKVLLERYPDLQRLQTSCHATHVDGDRIRPCGRCEKCRRVVGMLKALGGDPTRCGYTPSQIDACLERVVSDGVHQEGAGQEHMLSLLGARGVVPAPTEGRRGFQPHPEVMQLRFVEQRSPIDDVPPDLREGLYRVLLQHSQGAVRRRGREWIPCDPLGNPAANLNRAANRKDARATGSTNEDSERKEDLCSSSAN